MSAVAGSPVAQAGLNSESSSSSAQEKNVEAKELRKVVKKHYKIDLSV